MVILCCSRKTIHYYLSLLSSGKEKIKKGEKRREHGLDQRIGQTDLSGIYDMELPSSIGLDA